MPRYLKDFKNKMYFRRKYVPCFWCDLYLERKQATVEHLVSKANDGTNQYRNLVISCATCQVERSKLTGFFAMIIDKRIHNLPGWITNVRNYIPLILKYKKKCEERIKRTDILDKCIYELETLLSKIGYQSS